MHSVCAIGGALQPDSVARRTVTDFGLVCQFAANLPSHAQMPLRSFAVLTQHAQQVDQLKVYLNGYEECVGYVIWALLTPDVERAFIAGNLRPLAPWEFNDGNSLWILDMAVASGSLSYVLEDLRDAVFAEYTQLTYLRVKQGRRLFKRVSRNDRTSFMAAALHRKVAAT